VKCGKPRAFGRNAGAKEKVGNARLHFLGGFVGKGDGKNIFRGYAFGNEICHAKRDGARFAGTCARKDKQWPFGGFGGKTLFRIQLFEEREHCFRSGNFCSA
jgi:hypothetical protein